MILFLKEGEDECKKRKKKDIQPIIEELSVENYCATEPDVNPNYSGEHVWIFGITKELVDEVEDLYIKLKIRNLGDECLLVMSFHPEEPDKPEKRLQFPYKKPMKE